VSLLVPTWPYVCSSGLECWISKTDIAQQSRTNSAYHHHFETWGVAKKGQQKRTSDGETKNLRAARAKHKPLKPIVEKQLLTDCEFDLRLHVHREIIRDFTPDKYKVYERALVSVDRYLYSKLDQGKNGWSADVRGFCRPNGEVCDDTHSWRTMSDRCHTVALLIRAGLHGKAEQALDDVLLRLSRCDYGHPSFILMFWRVCIRIEGIDCHIPRAEALERLFLTVRRALPEDHVSHALIKSLSTIDRCDLRSVVRICFVKAIRTLIALVGDENIMVLDTISFYCKFFNASEIVKETLRSKFQYVWHQTYDTHPEGSLAAVAVDYAFASSAYYAFESPYLALSMAVKLRDTLGNHLRQVQSVEWTLETEAFSFTSKAVAELYRQRVNHLLRQDESPELAAEAYGKCCASMQGAIERLEIGDTECRTRAVMLSSTLNRWLVEWSLLAGWDLNEDAHREGLRLRRIEDSIPGKLCRRCLHVRTKYCKPCTVLFREKKPRKESCDKCVVDSSSTKTCQKCIIRRNTVGWMPRDKANWVKERKKNGLDSS
jgi:hypothetical protein